MDGDGSEIERIVREKQARAKRDQEEAERNAAAMAQEQLSARERWPTIKANLQKEIEVANAALLRSEAHAKFLYQENPQPGDGAVSRGNIQLLSHTGGTCLVANIIGMGDGRVHIDASSPVHTHKNYACEYQPNFREATSDFWRKLLTEFVSKCL